MAALAQDAGIPLQPGLLSGAPAAVDLVDPASVMGEPAADVPAAPDMPTPPEAPAPAAAPPPAPAAPVTQAEPGAGKPGERVNIIASQTSTGVAAIVNDFVISNYDLDQRTALFVATSGVRPTRDNLAQIRAQVLRSLEDEVLELQEAKKHKLTVAKNEVDKALQNIAEDNKLTVDQILNTIGQAGVSATTFRQQVTAQLTWQKLVSARYGSDIAISDAQVDEAMQRLKLGSDKPQFLVGEIFVAVDRPEDEANIRASAEQIANQIMQGAPFQTVAGQFSQSPSAADGGDIGWVVQGQLADELDHALSELRPGQTTAPIRAEGGFYVLQLRDRREPIGTKVTPTQTAALDPDAPVPLERLLIPLPAAADAMLKERAMALGNNVKGQIRSCADLQPIAKQLQGSVYTKLGDTNPKDLDPVLRDALLKTGPGEVVPPFFDLAGLELIVRCDMAPPKLVAFELPSREQLQQQLFVQQMGIYAKSYLRDLRRDAVVETR
ncbi:MAG TPA: peptidylprolyl isomerase [Micropepsaceae bacterium]|jgi:peptidyl-prolyl cis-trans isomerase SurA|nr:peptidylprolyl isomerase [Micropepsaceae bacterium]